MKLETIILPSAILFVGLMAGIFFTWSNAVKPGIGKLSDLEYLRALQSMNREILNIPFKIVFLGSLITLISVPIFYINLCAENIFWLFISAFVIYLLGVFTVTILGNIPLNELLDNTSLDNISINEAKALRKSIEVKWNNFNLVRSVSSSLTFVLLIFSYLFLNR
ncbi:MAG: DUF1772 domain-containing protein [Crocinitomicaceae bacterium]|nr:DUF1772 domain-containing protein [Crocinitomicaceae bacterium]MDG1735736.1 DUF1772 domain-containing protein [Crocinitomicaceae bacterium]